MHTREVRQSRCGAVLLRPGWALTAAHCLAPGVPAPPRLLASSGHVFAATSVHLHPGYRARPLALAARSDRQFAYNVALLKLWGPPSPNSLRLPPPLVEAAPPSSELARFADLPLHCLIFGWGRWEHAAEDSTLLDEDKLKYLNVQAFQYRGCSLEAGVTDARRVCVLGDTGLMTNTTSSCSGDSGGPLVCRVPGRGWRLLGLSSWNDEGILCDTASRYLHLGAFRDWLELTIRRHGHESPHHHKDVSSREQPRYDAASCSSGNIYVFAALASIALADVL